MDSRARFPTDAAWLLTRFLEEVVYALHIQQLDLVLYELLNRL